MKKLLITTLLLITLIFVGSYLYLKSSFSIVDFKNYVTNSIKYPAETYTRLSNKINTSDPRSRIPRDSSIYNSEEDYMNSFIETFSEYTQGSLNKWDYNKDPVLIRYRGSDSSTNTVAGDILVPANDNLKGLKTFKLECDTDNTVLLNSSFIKESFDGNVFDIFSKDSILSSYCLDSDCNELGEFCIVLTNKGSDE